MSTSIIIAILLGTIRLTPSIFIAGIGNMFSERAGILNLGAGGMMTIGALFSVLGSYYTGNAWLGLLCGILGGAITGLFYGIICAEFGGLQAIVGLGLNAFSSGLATYILINQFGTRISPSVPALNSMPLLKGIPFVGTFLSSCSPLVILAIFVTIISYHVIYNTPFGLQVRAIGDNPQAVETAGVNVWKMKIISVTICGAICGMAGSYLSIGILNRFIIGMIAGRGLMAVIAVKMGKWNPIGILLTALLFGFFDAIQMQIQLFSVIKIAPELIQIIPLIAGIVVLALQRSDNQRPQAIEVPYLKNKYKV
jgi:simple sugar transport system permease protein